ncbi:MAG: hypothetical protein J2P30_25180 [Actinobacteria bacterium]|nr:hypothetical protein [Actinomycetota bacterium]
MRRFSRHRPARPRRPRPARASDASVALHQKFGFTEAGTFREYAVKNGQYISSIWMQRLCRP